MSEEYLNTDQAWAALKARLIEVINDKNYKPMSLKELCILLDIPKDKRSFTSSVLEELMMEGKAGVSAKGKYGRTELFAVKGIFSPTLRGYGFVKVEGRNRDIFICEEDTKNALPGDTVLVMEDKYSEYGQHTEGKIIRILEHTLTQIVGTVRRHKKSGFILPDNQKINIAIHIEKGFESGAQNGDKVVAEITDYGTKTGIMKVKVKEVLGRALDPGVDVLSVVKDMGIPDEFSDEVMAEISHIPDEVLPEEKEGRRDIRDLRTVTIDGEDAKDLDDAVTISFENGIYHLGVHIADVTHYVKEGAALDNEALTRGTSVYFADRVIPMLPQKLSNGICSLNAGRDRLALSCFMDIDSNGNVINHEICETIIRVDRRMTYTTVTALIEGMEAPEEYRDFVGDFKLMKQLSDILRDKRFGRGAIDFDFPESKITLDEKGRPIDIRAYERSSSMRIIEDFMLLTNETIAEQYYWMEVPFVYRVHEKPDEEKLRSFAIFINNFGYSLHLTDHTVHPKELQKLLERIEGSDSEALISRILLRSLKRARYAPDNLGHYGLSAKYYCHFTSPIRRYPDLQIHRIIKDQLHGKLSEGRTEHYSQILPGVCDIASSRERRADDAERDVEKMKKAQYMRSRIGEVYSGVISGVTSYGFYVELDNTVEGLVHVSGIDGDYYVFDDKNYRLVGERYRKTFSVGQTVSVIVVDADPVSRQIEFRLHNPKKFEN